LFTNYENILGLFVRVWWTLGWCYCVCLFWLWLIVFVVVLVQIGFMWVCIICGMICGLAG